MKKEKKSRKEEKKDNKGCWNLRRVSHRESFVDMATAPQRTTEALAVLKVVQEVLKAARQQLPPSARRGMSDVVSKNFGRVGGGSPETLEAPDKAVAVDFAVVSGRVQAMEELLKAAGAAAPALVPATSPPPSD